MPRTHAGRVSINMRDADYIEFELAYYKYHPNSRSISFEEYLINGTPEKEMEEAVMCGRQGNRSERYCAYGHREYGHRSRGFGSAYPNESPVPPPVYQHSYHDSTRSRGVQDQRGTAGRVLEPDFERHGYSVGRSTRHDLDARDLNRDFVERGQSRGIGSRGEPSRHGPQEDIGENMLAGRFDRMHFGGDRGDCSHGRESRGIGPHYDSADDFDDESFGKTSRGRPRGTRMSPNNEAEPAPRIHREVHSPPRGPSRTPSPLSSRYGRGSSRPREDPRRQWERRRVLDGHSNEYPGSYGPQSGGDDRYGGRWYP